MGRIKRHNRPKISIENCRHDRPTSDNATKVSDNLHQESCPETEEDFGDGLKKWGQKEIRLVLGNLTRYARGRITPEIEARLATQEVQAAFEVARKLYERKRDELLTQILEWSIAARSMAKLDRVKKS